MLYSTIITPDGEKLISHDLLPEEVKELVISAQNLIPKLKISIGDKMGKGVNKLYFQKTNMKGPEIMTLVGLLPEKLILSSRENQGFYVEISTQLEEWKFYKEAALV